MPHWEPISDLPQNERVITVIFPTRVLIGNCSVQRQRKKLKAKLARIATSNETTIEFKLQAISNIPSNVNLFPRNTYW